MQRYQIREREVRDRQFFLSEEGTTLTKSRLYQLWKRISIEAEVDITTDDLVSKHRIHGTVVAMLRRRR
jgi:hypothetical protein